VEIFKLVVDLAFFLLRIAYFTQISKKNYLVWVVEFFLMRVAEQFGLRTAGVRRGGLISGND